MIIIFVGPDRCGKTTIAKSLSNLLKIPYFKNHTQKDFFNKDIDSLQKIYIEGNLQIQFFEQCKYSVVKDRDFPCEYAYSKTYGRKSDDKFIFSLDERYSKLDTLIIYCYKMKYKEYKDEFVDIEKIETLKKYYNEFLDQSKCKVIKMTTDDEYLPAQLDLIISVMREFNLR